NSSPSILVPWLKRKGGITASCFAAHSSLTMGLYEALKDAVSVAQKADNIEIMRALFEAQKQALDVLDLLREKDDIIRALEKEVDRLKESVRIRGNVKEWQGWFFLVDEDKNWKYPP